MKKANVNLFDKNKVQLKLLKNKNLRISDGRRNPTRVINLRKTGITIWTDGKHLKVFRGNLLKEIIGRSVYRTNKFETVEFVGANKIAERRSMVKNNNALEFVGVDNVQEGRSIGDTKSLNFVGVDNVQEGRSVGGTKSPNFVGVDNVQEGRTASKKDVVIVCAKNTSEARILEGTYAVYIDLNNKSVTIRHGQI